jgi:hypothetical protein
MTMDRPTQSTNERQDASANLYSEAQGILMAQALPPGRFYPSGGGKPIDLPNGVPNNPSSQTTDIDLTNQNRNSNSNNNRIDANTSSSSDANAASNSTSRSNANSSSASNSSARTGDSNSSARSGDSRSSATGGNVNLNTEVFDATQAPTIVPSANTSVYTRFATRNGDITTSAAAANSSESGALNVFVPGTVGVGISFGESSPDKKAMDQVVRPAAQDQRDLVGTFLANEARASGVAPETADMLQQTILQNRLQRSTAKPEER